MSGGTLAALDIGGTKIAAALVDAEGTVLRRGRVPTPAGGGPAVLAAAAGLLDGLADGPVRGLGVGAPGVIDPATGRVVSATDVLPGWAGTPVRETLAELTGLPVTVVNDVRAMAYGEARAGAGTGFHRVLHVSVGTGVGGALTTGGDLDHGAHGTAGELAHLLVPDRGPVPCGCGRRDHLEAVASGPAIAATGDAPRAGTLLGRALAGLLAVVDPDAVVIGGGVAQIGPPYLDAVAAAFRAEALPPLRATPIVTARLGTDAPLVGAALLAATTPHGSAR
ncbi:ROK family protein [Actinomadura montaniterrae]|uniref:ROK family protein n=1 Tax=Actinomadura montaniterrae TaxID=1803903 RepID=A0A6L3VSA4_9ACTN|nr:ROK family protein [Actinomadura montaniterrae]KAB2379942.1 ROK family protein [Actinomadura montaniterrae]